MSFPCGRLVSTTSFSVRIASTRCASLALVGSSSVASDAASCAAFVRSFFAFRSARLAFPAALPPAPSPSIFGREPRRGQEEARDVGSEFSRKCSKKAPKKAPGFSAFNRRAHSRPRDRVQQKQRKYGGGGAGTSGVSRGAVGVRNVCREKALVKTVTPYQQVRSTRSRRGARARASVPRSPGREESGPCWRDDERVRGWSESLRARTRSLELFALKSAEIHSESHPGWPRQHLGHRAFG